jgi:uncharacterized protein YxjI
MLMKLFMKQKVFSIGDKYTIKDEFNNDRWQVKGDVFSIGHKLHVYDMVGNEVAFVQQKVMSFRPRFFVFVGGVQVAEIVKDFTLFHQHYRIEGTSISLDGDVFQHNYSLIDMGNIIMNVTKAWFSWGDSFLLDIADDSNELLCLSIVLALDSVIDSEKRG